MIPTRLVKERRTPRDPVTARTATPQSLLSLGITMGTDGDKPDTNGGLRVRAPVLGKNQGQPAGFHPALSPAPNAGKPTKGLDSRPMARVIHHIPSPYIYIVISLYLTDLIRAGA